MILRLNCFNAQVHNQSFELSIQPVPDTYGQLKQELVSAPEKRHALVSRYIDYSFANIQSDSIRNLPGEISKYSYLTDLYLKMPALLKVPLAVFKLKELKKLFIIYSGHYPIGKKIKQLKNLESLTIQSSHESGIGLPPQIGDMRLHYLELKNMELDAFPVFITKIKSLDDLTINTAKLKKIIPEIKLLENLISLDLNDNQIESIPPEIKSLKNLRSLSLKNNKLTVFPTEVFTNDDLHYLYLDGNALSSLPDDIGKLKNLKILSLVNNPLSEEQRQKIKNALPDAKIIFN